MPGLWVWRFRGIPQWGAGQHGLQMCEQRLLESYARHLRGSPVEAWDLAGKAYRLGETIPSSQKKKKKKRMLVWLAEQTAGSTLLHESSLHQNSCRTKQCYGRETLGTNSALHGAPALLQAPVTPEILFIWELDHLVMIGQQNTNAPLNWNHFSHRLMSPLFLLRKKKECHWQTILNDV